MGVPWSRLGPLDHERGAAMAEEHSELPPCAGIRGRMRVWRGAGSAPDGSSRALPPKALDRQY